jgi:hypothetical protein
LVSDPAAALTLSRVWIGRDQWKSAPARKLACQKAAKIARFMTENCDDFGADVDFIFP